MLENSATVVKGGVMSNVNMPVGTSCFVNQRISVY